MQIAQRLGLPGLRLFALVIRATVGTLIGMVMGLAVNSDRGGTHSTTARRTPTANSLRRVISFALLLTCASCGPNRIEVLQSQNEELQDQVTQLQSQLEVARTATTDVREKADALKSASDDLSSETDAFNSDNWQDVVSRVKASSDQVDSAAADLDSSVGDLETATEEK